MAAGVSQRDKITRIGIDKGAGYGRDLTAVVLSGTERRFLQVRRRLSEHALAAFRHHIAVMCS